MSEIRIYIYNYINKIYFFKYLMKLNKKYRLIIFYEERKALINFSYIQEYLDNRKVPHYVPTNIYVFSQKKKNYNNRNF